MGYDRMEASKAYELLNPGGMIWVCTKSARGRYDLAPIAWNCPLDYEPTSRVLFVCDPKHATFENLSSSGVFAIALPTPEQRALVEKTGSVSGRDKDKFAEFGIGSTRAGSIDVLVPDGVAAWIECRLVRTVTEGSVAVVMGEAVAAAARDGWWKERLHYLGEGRYYRPSGIL